MCGCDYNNRTKIKSKSTIKDISLGPVKAYKLIEEHKSINNIKDKVKINIYPLNYEQCRKIFTEFDERYIKHKELALGTINKNNLILFLEKNRCRMSKSFWEDMDCENNFFNFDEFKISVNDIN